MPFYNVTSVTLSRSNSINAIEVECPLVHWGYLWDIFGISLGYLWDIFGISWEYLGNILGISREYLGNVFGISRLISWGNLWDNFGISLGYLGDIFKVINWAIVPLDHWFIGPLVPWSIGSLVECQMCKVNIFKLFSERTSGVPPFIFRSMPS